MKSAILSALDLATRPVLAPIYLIAARLSVPVARWLRTRPGKQPISDNDTHFEAFPSPNPKGPAEPAEWPTVTIVIPVLNGEKVLGRCLESIRALDYPGGRMDVVVADNGSTDRTLEIARQYGVRTVVQPKRGAAAARNAAVAATSGDWIAMTDADCVVHPFWLKQLVGAALREKCGAAGGRIFSICRDAVVRDFCEREGVLDQRAAIEGRLLPFPFVITANGLFRRDALASVGGFDEEFADAAAEDVDLGWRLSERGVDFAYAPDAWVCHRQRGRGIDIHAQFYRYGLSEVQLYLKHRARFSPRDLSKHLWIRPLLYRHFWKAVVCWATSCRFSSRHLWRLVVLKELGHMAGKLEGNRRWCTWRCFRLWSQE
jgi:cellulose synthase/poly-beta-1,6-N-acetylglucosamine synthase-like glycosyltransferase